MAQSINLIPQEEVQEQIKVRLVKFSTIISLFLFLIVAGVSAYFFYATQNLKKQIVALDQEIDKYRNEITTLSDVEVIARNLDKKYNALKAIFNKRIYYSMLVQELYVRKPTTIKFDSFSSRDDTKLSISGDADDYISVADFTNNLLNQSFSSGNEKLKNLFTSVTLNSVSLNSKDSKVSFAITVEFNKELLKR